MAAAGLAFATTDFLVVFFVLPADELELLESESESLLLEPPPLESVLLVGGDGLFFGPVAVLEVVVALAGGSARLVCFFGGTLNARRAMRSEIFGKESELLTRARVRRRIAARILV